jgi:hypothetical protein
MISDALNEHTPSTPLADLLRLIIEPELVGFQVVRKDGTTEDFRPLTLMESFIESELHLDDAAVLFDCVMAAIRSRGMKRFSHHQLHAVVVESMMTFPPSKSIQWLRNYDNAFGPDFESLDVDGDFVPARNASVLKKYLVEMMNATAGVKDQHALEELIGKSEVDAATNRVLKIIRYCGFYKVRASFLRAFCAELAEVSVKGLIPTLPQDVTGIERKLKKVEEWHLIIRHRPNEDCAQKMTLLNMAMEDLGIALVSKFGFMPRLASCRSFEQFLKLLSDGQRLYMCSPDMKEFHPTVILCEEIRKLFQGTGIGLRYFLDTLSKLHEASQFVEKFDEARQLFGRVLRIARILLLPPTPLHELRAVDVDKDGRSVYVVAVAKYLANAGYEVNANGDDSEISVNISARTNAFKLLQFGGAIVITFADRDGVEPLGRRWCRLVNRATHSGVVIVVLGVDDLDEGDFTELRTAVNERNAAVIPMAIEQFEQAVSIPELSPDRLFTTLVKMCPELEARGNVVFDIPLPADVENLNLESARDSLRRGWDCLRRGDIKGCGFHSGATLEETLRDHLTFLAQLTDCCRYTEQTKLIWGVLSERKGMSEFVRCLRVMRDKGSAQQELLWAFLPDRSMLDKIDALRRMRNGFVHDTRPVTKTDAEALYNGVVLVLTVLSAKHWKRRRVQCVEISGDQHLISPTGSIVVRELALDRRSIRPELGCICLLVEVSPKPFLVRDGHICGACGGFAVYQPGPGKVACSSCHKSAPMEAHLKRFIERMADAMPKSPKEPKMSISTLTVPNKEGARKWAKVFAEGLATALGPFGAPFKSYAIWLSTADQSKLSKLIEERIAGSDADTAVVLATLDDVSSDLRELKAMFVENTMQIATLLSKRFKGESADAYRYIRDMQWPFFRASSVAEVELVDELAKLYGNNMKMFWHDVEISGFNTTRIDHDGAPELAVGNFIRECKRASRQSVHAVFMLFKAKNPTSNPLDRVTSSLEVEMRLVSS